MTSADVSFIERLRKENLEQFFTLVRMHLSFVVDINTDDVDSSTDKPKQFRWNFHKKGKSSTSNSSQTNINNIKNNVEVNSITEEGILRLNELIDFLSIPENVKQEGIFRRTGSLARQQELRQLLLTGSSLGLDEGRFSVHDCASVLKGFLADLPQPLLMDQYYQTYNTLASQYPPSAESSEPKLLTALQLLLLLLTQSHRCFLERLLCLLRLVADNEASNRMSPDTLATMFTPHLLCPRKLSPETFHADSIALSPVISFMIRHSSRLFHAPTQLVTDACAYFTVRDRKRVMSPDLDLDESITDKSAPPPASTVYTFVDRLRTRAENAANPTDAALAQLYAHIQALPPSQHKQRLIKHFNRQNGYGTPIQVQRTGKVAGSRSFGDSIKRHIFNKGLLNKTPKKGSGSNINAIDEKARKGKRYTNENKDVSHKNIVLKNLANKIASTESLDDYESDASNESTLSDGALNISKKRSPKFVSEPNLSVLDAEETPKNTKTKRLFRSKVLSATNLNKKYRKRNSVIKGTPTCVSCFENQDTDEKSDESVNENESLSVNEETPKKTESKSVEIKLHYLTSTPGVSEAMAFDDNTPYSMNFRRASMSPITKSTQKLSKAMQESIMTPRSRKPLIVTCEQRDSLPETAETAETAEAKDVSTKSSPDVYQSMSPKNDSDFVSSDDEDGTKSTFSCERSNQSNSSVPLKTPFDNQSLSLHELSPLRSQKENSQFIYSHENQDVNTTLITEVVPNLPKISVTKPPKSLTAPFREYLLSRSVLTATPIDLSINKSNDSDDQLSDSLMYCLDGNMPSDLTLSISNLAVESRSPLQTLNLECQSLKERKSPRKRCGSASVYLDTASEKKNVVGKENCEVFQVRETDL